MPKSKGTRTLNIKYNPTTHNKMSLLTIPTIDLTCSFPFIVKMFYFLVSAIFVSVFLMLSMVRYNS